MRAPAKLMRWNDKTARTLPLWAGYRKARNDSTRSCATMGYTGRWKLCWLAMGRCSDGAGGVICAAERADLLVDLKVRMGRHFTVAPSVTVLWVRARGGKTSPEVYRGPAYTNPQNSHILLKKCTPMQHTCELFTGDTSLHSIRHSTTVVPALDIHKDPDRG